MIQVQGYTIIIKKSSIGQNRHRWNEDDGKLCSLRYTNWAEVKTAIDMLRREYHLKDCKDFIVSHGDEARTGEPDLKDEDFNITNCSWLKFDADKTCYELFEIQE